MLSMADHGGKPKVRGMTPSYPSQIGMAVVKKSTTTIRIANIDNNVLGFQLHLVVVISRVL